MVKKDLESISSSKGVDWSPTKKVIPLRKRKPVDVKVALLGHCPERFVLHGSAKVDTFWSLHDSKNGSTYFLFAHGWDGAQREASRRIREILTKT